MGDSIKLRMHLLPWIISGTVILSLFIITGGLPGCGDFALWEEKSTIPDDDDDTTLSCDNPFPGLEAFDESGTVTALDETLIDPVSIAVVPVGMDVSFTDEDDTVSAQVGDLLVVDENEDKVYFDDFSDENDSTHYPFFESEDQLGGIALLGYELPTDVFNFFFYSEKEGTGGKVKIDWLGQDVYEPEDIISENDSEFATLIAVEFEDNIALFALDSQNDTVHRWSVTLAELFTFSFSLSSEILMTGTSLKDMAFSAVDGSLYVLDGSTLQEITDAVTATAPASPSEFYLDSFTGTPSGITIAYTNYTDDEADEASLLVVVQGTVDDPDSILEFELETGDYVDTFFPQYGGNDLTDLESIAYDCQNGRLLMTNNPSGSGALYEVTPAAE